MRTTITHPPGDILKLNAWMKAYASRVKAFYADYFSALVDERGWLKENCSNDGLHPNGEGYKIMAPIVEAAIEKLSLKIGTANPWLLTGLLNGVENENTSDLHPDDSDRPAPLLRFCASWHFRF